MRSNDEIKREGYENDYEGPFESNFIYLENIPEDKMKDSFNNLFKGKPQKNIEGKFENKKEILSDNNNMKNLTNPKEEKSSGDLASDEKFTDKISKINLVNIKFVQRAVNSLFEYFARDIIYQLFNYHQMYYYNYKFTSKKDNEDTKIGEKYNKEDKKIEPLNSKKDKIDETNINKEVIKTEGSNNYKEETQIKIDNAEENKIVEANNNKVDKKIQNIDIINKNEENLNSKIEKVEKNSNNINLFISDDNKNKNTKGPNKNKAKIKKNNNEILYYGDFDFIIPNISFEEISKVLNNKEISPFIFYGNIKKYMEYDIIGEIKENLGQSQRNNDQINKYISLIKLLRTDKNANEAVGLNLRNEKLILIYLYVFNSGYQKFLFKMIEYKRHFEQFEMIDKKFKNEHYKKLINIERKFKAETKDETKSDIVNEIISSSIPYIFIFIPSITNFISITKNKDSKIEKLNSRINDLEKQINIQKKILKLILMLILISILIKLIINYFNTKENIS